MKRWNSVFASLAVSYVSMTLILVLLLGCFFYIYVSNSYRQELQIKSRLEVEKAAQAIEAAVLQRVQKIYLELALDKTVDVRLLAASALIHNQSKLIDLQEMLKSKVDSNSELVQAIHLYSPGQQVILSSAYGLLQHPEEQEDISAWLSGWMSGTDSQPWTAARLVPQDVFSHVPGGEAVALLTYVQRYPFQTGGGSDLLLAIDVKESALGEAIRGVMAEGDAAFILDRMGHTVARSSQGSLAPYNGLGAEAAELLRSVPATDEAGSGLLENASRIVVYQALPSSGWRLYIVARADVFYAPLAIARQRVLGICLGAIALGIILSAVWASASYRPMKRLVRTMRGMVEPSPEQGANEYRWIGTAWSKLNDKLSRLEEQLQASSPAREHTLLLNLLYNRYPGEEAGKELRALCRLQKYSHYACAIVQAGAGQEPSGEALMRGVTERLKRMALQRVQLIAADLPDGRIAVVVCTASPSDTLPEELSAQLLSGRTGSEEQRLAWGGWVPELTDLHQSYAQAQTLMKYGYFLPELTMLKDRRLLERESSQEELAPAIWTRFRDTLHARRAHEAAEVIRDVVAMLREGNYAADYGRYMLVNMVFIYSDYVQGIRLQPEHDRPELYRQFSGLRDIAAFEEWLTGRVAQGLGRVEQRRSERALSSIELARQYIDHNLSGDLSLDAVAAQVFLSPKYVSKLFKEELGVTYTEYVTRQRMERARALIVDNRMTVEQIASTVGYGTAAYFIKKFKELHGCTPGYYLRSLAQQT